MEIEKVFRRYNDMLFRICLVQLCNEADAEDAVQDTFYRYMECKQAFRGEEHRKAWLIRVAVNICRDIQRKRRRQQPIDMEALGDYYETESDGRLLEAMMELPEKLKTVLYLHYVEGYQVREISGFLRCSEAAVKKRLQRGRESLRENLSDGEEQEKCI